MQMCWKGGVLVQIRVLLRLHKDKRQTNQQTGSPKPEGVNPSLGWMLGDCLSQPLTIVLSSSFFFPQIYLCDSSFSLQMLLGKIKNLQEHTKQ